LVVSGRKPADHNSVPACPDPPFADTFTAQFAAPTAGFWVELALAGQPVLAIVIGWLIHELRGQSRGQPALQNQIQSDNLMA
jgi:hypothetical protein